MSVGCCERAIAQVRAQIGKTKVVYGFSEGVDSSVVAVLLLVHAIGVMGDGRTYDQACALRAVTSTRCAASNRVTYDITSKPPGTIEWE